MSNLLVSWIPDIVGETSIVAGIPNFEGEFPFVLWWLCLNRASQSTSKNGSTYQQTSVFPIETNVFRIFLGYDIPDTVCTIFRDNLISYCLLWIPSWSHDIPVISFYPHRLVSFHQSNPIFMIKSQLLVKNPMVWLNHFSGWKSLFLRRLRRPAHQKTSPASFSVVVHKACSRLVASRPGAIRWHHAEKSSGINTMFFYPYVDQYLLIPFLGGWTHLPAILMFTRGTRFWPCQQTNILPRLISISNSWHVNVYNQVSIIGWWP